MVSDDLVKHLRGRQRTTNLGVSDGDVMRQAADRIEALQEGLARTQAQVETAMQDAQEEYDRAEALQAERDEAKNQLDSALHSVDVLEKRFAALQAQPAKTWEDALRKIKEGALPPQFAGNGLNDFIAALLDTPTPAPSLDDLVMAALEWAASKMDMGAHTMPHYGILGQKEVYENAAKQIRAAATDPATVAAIIERAWK